MRVCSKTQSTMAPKMSNWIWLYAAFPVRTGRLPRSRSGDRAPTRWESRRHPPGRALEGWRVASCRPDMTPPGGSRTSPKKGQEVVGLGVKSERVQRPQRESGVTDPGEAIVPVPAAAEVLRQRGRRRRQQRPRRRVGQPLEGERAALEELSPRMIGKAPTVDPVAPEATGLGATRVYLARDVGGRSRIAPTQHDEGRLALG